MLMAHAATLLSPETLCRLQHSVLSLVRQGYGHGRGIGKTTCGGSRRRLLAATLGPSDGVAAGLVESGGLGVALPCVSAKRSRVFPEVFDETARL